jgi:hypothetical protein
LSTAGFRLYDGPQNIQWFPEDQTSGYFAAGNVVILSSGEVTIATDDDDIWGVALKGYTGTTGTMIPVSVITPDQRWLAYATSTTATTIIGTSYALTLTYGSQGVNTASTTTPAFMVEDILKSDKTAGATTGAGGWVIGRFVYTSMDAIGG